jgi:DNA-binding NarL/FixJ family response regulator
MSNDINLIAFYTRLTTRQQQVLQLVVVGYTNREIAELLYIEPSVVAGHLTNLYDLLHNHLATDPANRPKRYTVIRLFATFFDQYPELAQYELAAI